MKKSLKRPALMAALVGIIVACTEGGKLALATLPNIEVVTLFTALFSYVFGWLGVLSAFIFVIVETLIWGFGSWVIAYFIYWPLVGAVFLFLRRLGIKNRIPITAAALLLTVFFGFLTSLAEIGLFSGFWDNFWTRFWIYYLRGTMFYAVHIASNAVLFPLLFPFLSGKLEKIKDGILR